MFQLRNAMLGGRSRNINGVNYTSDEIRAQRKSQLTAMGIQNMSEKFESDIRCCKNFVAHHDPTCGKQDGACLYGWVVSNLKAHL